MIKHAVPPTGGGVLDHRVFRDTLGGMETAYLVIFVLTFVAIALASAYVVRKLYQ